WSPLFPYTTLFRSPPMAFVSISGLHVEAAVGRRGRGVVALGSGRRGRVLVLAPLGAAAIRGGAAVELEPAEAEAFRCERRLELARVVAEERRRRARGAEIGGAVVDGDAHGEGTRVAGVEVEAHGIGADVEQGLRVG